MKQLKMFQNKLQERQERRTSKIRVLLFILYASTLEAQIHVYGRIAMHVFFQDDLVMHTAAIQKYNSKTHMLQARAVGVFFLEDVGFDGASA